MHLYIYIAMFISYYVCLKCRGRVVTNVVRTCDPTPLLYIFGNKICLNYLKVSLEKKYQASISPVQLPTEVIVSRLILIGV